ncbi:MAG: hypothetical protein F7C34_03050 [Desulfurococcales archaeon]|nr:hypothetical protein [Desulfurococcales archaeon]
MLSSMGAEVTAYDTSPVYTKPCGDALTLRPWLRRLAEEMDAVVTSVESVTIRVEGQVAEEIDFGGSVWYIIDKHSLVRRLREEASRLGASIRRGRAEPPCRCRGECVCLDARGPYAHSRATWVFASRAIARLSEPWNRGHALIDFYPRRGGLYWVFPASDDGRLVNLGAGWLGEAPDKALRDALRIARGELGRLEVVDRRAAPIAVFSPIRPAGPSTIRLGEAGGFINSSAGEGNRPALETARIAAQAVSRASGPDEAIRGYREGTRGLVSEMRASRIALRLAVAAPSLFSRALRGMGRGFWEKYLRAELSMGSAVRYLLLLPIALARG